MGKVIAKDVCWLVDRPADAEVLLDYPLTERLEPRAGVGPVAFSRASTCIVTDAEGILRQVGVNVPAFTGARWIGSNQVSAYDPNGLPITKFYRQTRPLTNCDETNWASSRGGYATVQTGVKINGGGSILLDVGNPASTHYLSRGGFSFHVSNDSDLISIAIYLPQDVNTSGNILVFFTTDTGFTDHWYKTYTVVGKKAGWHLLEFPRSQFVVGGGSPSWSNPITDVRVRLDSTVNDTKAYVDSLFIAPRATPHVVMVFDDGNSTDYSVAWPYMQAKGIRGTSAIVSSLVNGAGYMTTAQMTEMYATGWDFINHTATHIDLVAADSATRISEITTCRDFLISNGFPRAANYLAYPYGAVPSVYDELQSCGVVAARTTSPVLVDTATGVTTKTPYTIAARITLAAANSLATVKAAVDDAIAKGQTIIIYAHKLVASNPSTYEWLISDFQALIDYIAEKKAAGQIYDKTFRGWWLYQQAETRGILIEPQRTNKCTNYNANPTALINIFKSGDAAATLTVVDDTAALLTAGLEQICSSGKVYKLDNSAGTGYAYATANGTCGNLNGHAGSVYHRGGTGALCDSWTSGSFLTLPSVTGYTRARGTFTPVNTGSGLTVRASAGQVVYFILNQLEEGVTVTSPIIVSGAAATRAASTGETNQGLRIPRAGNYRDTLTVSFDWIPGFVPADAITAHCGVFEFNQQTEAAGIYLHTSTKKLALYDATNVVLSTYAPDDTDHKVCISASASLGRMGLCIDGNDLEGSYRGTFNLNTYLSLGVGAEHPQHIKNLRITSKYSDSAKRIALTT